MRNKIRCCFIGWVLLLVSLAAMADSNIVSRPVGVTTINIPAGSQVPASLPYVPFVPMLDSVIGGQLTNDVEILLWNNTVQKYEQVRRVDGKWVQVSSTVEVSIVAGDAFWVVNRQHTNQTLLLGGEVNLAGSNATTLLPGLNLVGLPQNMAVPVERSGLAGLGRDRLVDAHGNAASNMVPGEGYWYARNEAGYRAWVEILPYSADTFPAEGSLPAITAIKVQSPLPGQQAPSVTLAIALNSNCRKVDIYYKDQASSDTLVLDKDWLIAEADLPVSGKTTLEWADVANSQRKPVGEVFARYYLVGNADFTGTNGIPESRSKFVFNKVSATLISVPAAVSGLSSNGSSFASSSNLFSVSLSLRLPVSSSIGHIIYVDRSTGADHLTGKAPVVVGADGPKKTVRAGLQEAGNDGNTMIIKSGTYRENLNISGRNVKVVIQGNVGL